MRRRKDFGRTAILGSIAGIVAGLTASVALGQTNLLLDPGFEAGVNGAPDASTGDIAMANAGPWLSWNNWVAPYSGYYASSFAGLVPHSGNQVAKTFSGPNGGVYQFVTVFPGDTYTASAWFDNSSTANGGLDALNGAETDDVRMIFFTGANGTGGNLGTFVTPVPVSDLTTPDTWTQLSVTQQAPAGASSVQWMAFFNNPGFSGGAMYLDDASLIDTTPVWSGGSTIGNTWSSGSNWQGTAPSATSNLIFDGSTRLASQNDFAAGTAFGSIRFNPTASSFVISGNAINLGGDVINNSPNNQTINLNLALQQNTNLNAAAGNLTIGGNISGGFSLTANGPHVVTLKGANTYGGGTTVTAGTLVIGAAGALPANSAVEIDGPGNMQLATGTGGETLSSLTITGNGTLDITNNHVIINYGGGPDPIATIKSLIFSGNAGGTWLGTGITSTAALANSGSYGIGYADSADPGNPAGLAPGTIEVMYTLLGDANLDKKVNGTDFAILATNFNQAVGGWDQGDFNYDNKANGSDFASLATNFNQGASQADLAALDAFASANGLLTSVPEPSTIALLSGGLLLAARRKRRR